MISSLQGKDKTVTFVILKGANGVLRRVTAS